jgi:hypothetical protein
MNNMLLLRAEKWLNELGIKTEQSQTMLKVNRTDMVSLLPGTWESQYDEILGEMKKALNSPRLFWGMKDDEWLYLESY